MPGSSNVHKRIAEGSPEPRLVFHGPVASPQDALRQMDVLFLPSRVEGFGLVLIEAMASGVPVIGIAAGGVTDVIEDKVNGLFIECDHFLDEHLGLALKKLIEDPVLRAQVIAGGLKTVAEKFSWEVVLPQYGELLKFDRPDQS